METQCIDVIYGKVEKINISNQTKETTKTIRSLEYIPIVKDKKEGKDKNPKFNNSKHLETESSQSSNILKKTVILLPQDKVIVCMGPWTPTLLHQCPISGLRAHSITVDPLEYEIKPYALFNEIKLNSVDIFTPEIYTRKQYIYIYISVVKETIKWNHQIQQPIWMYHRQSVINCTDMPQCYL